MKAWERRLSDLANLLQNCHSTYMDPDLFRMNANQFLQTARTVIFIIQKNKESIPSFDQWYVPAVVDGWKEDKVMRWAKEARNAIEKEGDLELHSSLNARLIYSYFVEQDMTMEIGRTELLNFGVAKLVRYAQKKLVRFAQQKLPSGVSDVALIKIERCWVASTIKEWELLRALLYVYTRHLECCKSLAAKLGTKLDESIPAEDHFEYITSETRQVRYFKLNGMQTHSLVSERIKIDRSFKPPEHIQHLLTGTSIEKRPVMKSLTEASEWYKKMAIATFEHYGNHTFMLFILDKAWRPIDMMNPHFEDQADKFIFWRMVAENITNQKAFGAIWIGESWRRTATEFPHTPMRNMPITGERLSLVGIDGTGTRLRYDWEIVRSTPDAKPTLKAMDIEDVYNEKADMFLMPVARALGVPDPEFLKGVF